MKKKITLREIASKAKVSAATASIVLNDKKNQGISEKTWKNVKVKDQYRFNNYSFLNCSIIIDIKNKRILFLN